jgi:DNA mismatch endonuclease (patch repair protein)
LKWEKILADIFSKIKRSKIMSSIHGTGNKSTEIVLAKLLSKNHIIGWRRKQKVFGSPDFVIKKKKIAIFVDGCFWHGCPYHGTIPKTNKSFWKNKIIKNKKRDKKVNRLLRKNGWKVIRIWNHELIKLSKKSKLRRLIYSKRDKS